MKKAAFATLVLASMLPAGAALAQQKMDGMKTAEMAAMPAASSSMSTSHTAMGVVKKVDTKAATVTVAHEPVKSMNWPAMTMGFKVKDKMLLDKFTDGKKVEFNFVQQGKNYVITSVK